MEVHYVRGLQLTNFDVRQLMNGENGVTGVIARKGYSIEKETVTMEMNAMEVYLVLGIPLSTVNVHKIVISAPAGTRKYVELTGRIIEMNAWPDVWGLLWNVATANVHVMIKTAGLILTVTRMVRPVNGGPGAPVTAGMGCVYGMENGVDGHLGVIVIRIVRR